MQNRLDSQLMRRTVLVLNKNWQAIHVTNVARAVTLLFAKQARVVDPQNYATYCWETWSQAGCTAQLKVRSAHLTIGVPEIILLARFDRVPRVAVHFSRRNLLQRDRCTCQFCGAQPGLCDLTIDHVVPRSHGGQTNWENCVTACWDCNRNKANRTPTQAGMRLRRQPHRPEWVPLFSSSKANPRWPKFVFSKAV